MFGFANALLLALFAAAGVDLVLALRCKAVGQLFTVPHYLFGDWGGEARARWGQRAFLLALMLYEFTVVFCNSMARENWPFLQGQLAPVLDMIMYTLLCGKILLGTRYTWRELICAGALYFVARWVYFNGQNIWFLGLVMVLLAAKDVPLRRSLQAFLGCGVPTLALVEVLHFAGIIAPDALSERSGSYRLMFGYGHPNTFGGIVFGLVLAWVLLRQAKITWAEIAAVAGVGLFLCKGPASRSPALCAFLLAVLLVCAKSVGARKGRKRSRCYHEARASQCAFAHRYRFRLGIRRRSRRLSGHRNRVCDPRHKHLFDKRGKNAGHAHHHGLHFGHIRVCRRCEPVGRPHVFRDRPARQV